MFKSVRLVVALVRSFQEVHDPKEYLKYHFKDVRYIQSLLEAGMSSCWISNDIHDTHP
jgi:hypothetical protein